MIAAYYNNLDVVRCHASDHGAKIEATDANGRTALMIAAFKEHFDVVRCLASDHGAKIEATDANGATALMLAAYGHVEIVRFLASDHGAKIEATDARGMTTLMHAAGHGRGDVVRCLASDHGAKIEAMDAEGSTALMIAASHGRLDVVRCLAQECGANLNVRVGHLDEHPTLSQITPHQIALRNGHKEVARLLVSLTVARAKEDDEQRRSEEADKIARAKAAEAELLADLENSTRATKVAQKKTGTVRHRSRTSKERVGPVLEDLRRSTQEQPEVPSSPVELDPLACSSGLKEQREEEPLGGETFETSAASS
jgi:ankyrin repeat protein